MSIIVLNVLLDEEVLVEVQRMSDPRMGGGPLAGLWWREIKKVEQGTLVQGTLEKIKREPNPVIYADNGRIRWKNERQKNFVLMTLRKNKNMPYKRTHRLSGGWRVLAAAEHSQLFNGGIYFINSQTRGGVEIERLGYKTIVGGTEGNIYPYVQGDWTQPFHLDSRWPQASEIVAIYSPAIEREIVQAWYNTMKGITSYLKEISKIRKWSKATYWKWANANKRRWD